MVKVGTCLYERCGCDEICADGRIDDIVRSLRVMRCEPDATQGGGRTDLEWCKLGGCNSDTVISVDSRRQTRWENEINGGPLKKSREAITAGQTGFSLLCGGNSVLKQPTNGAECEASKVNGRSRV
jgi:hypothetical protein